MNIKTTYEDAKRAFTALGLLASDGKYAQKIPLKSALRIRRTLGVLRPLVIDLEELSEKIIRDSGWDRQVPPPVDLNSKLKELMLTEVVVGAEPFSPADLGLPETVPSTIVGVLYEMGPFFVEAAEEQSEATSEEVLN